MVNYCVYSDVHSNFDALKALVLSPEFAKCDKRYFLGDAVNRGAFPCLSLAEIRKYSDVFIKGNHDDVASVILSLEEEEILKKNLNNNQNYTRDNLSASDKAFLRDLQLYRREKLGGKKVLFLHFLWKNERILDLKTNRPNVEFLDECFGDDEADVIIFGHEHKPLFLRGKKIYIGVGSLGVTYPAPFLVISEENKSLTVTFNFLEYDIDSCRKIMSEDFIPGSSRYLSSFKKSEYKKAEYQI